VNVVEAFVVDQPVTVIFAGESLDLAALMLQGAAVDAVGHTDVERAGATGHDVDEIFVILHGNIHDQPGECLAAFRVFSASPGVLRFAQGDRNWETL